MEIGDVAAKQFEDTYSDMGTASRATIREAVRKWNALEEPQTLSEGALFDLFREIERKAFGLIP